MFRTMFTRMIFFAFYSLFIVKNLLEDFCSIYLCFLYMLRVVLSGLNCHSFS